MSAADVTQVAGLLKQAQVIGGIHRHLVTANKAVTAFRHVTNVLLATSKFALVCAAQGEGCVS